MTDNNPKDEGRDYLLPDKVYHALKRIALVVLPALAVFVNTVGPTLGLPHVDAIVTTINALSLLIAACIGVSQAKTATGK